MRLLHIAAGIDPRYGGVSRAIQMMISSSSDSGVYNEIVCLDNPNALYLESFTCDVHALGPTKAPWHYCTHLVPWLVKNYLRFDVVIVHGLWLYHGFAARKALQKIKDSVELKYIQIPKLFVMPHGMLDPYFQKPAGRKLKAFRNWIYWKLIEKKLINSAEAILFTCNVERELASRSFSPYTPKQQIVVGLGVEKPPLYNETMRSSFLLKCPEIIDESYLLFLSRIHEKKGVDLLISAYCNLREQGQQMPKLVIAGSGLDSSYGRKLLDQVAENKLEKEIFFPGMLNGNAKWGAFYNCDAFVLPSHQENFGIAVVEAMACGKAVLITDQINIYQEIAQAGAGIITKDTQEEIYLMLRSWIELSGIQKKAMQSIANRLYEANYDVNLATKRLLSAISV